MTTATTDTTTEALSAAQTAQRGRERLAEVETRLADLRHAQEALTARQREHAAAITAAQRIEADIRAAQEALEQEIARHTVARLLQPERPQQDPQAERPQAADADSALFPASENSQNSPISALPAAAGELAALEQHRTTMAKELLEAQHAVAVAQKAQERDARLSQKEAAALAQAIATQERLATALREAITAAHQQAGLDALAALQGEQDALVEQRRQALAAFTAANVALFGHSTACADRLAPWPELAREGADALTGGLMPWHDVGDVFVALIDALQRQAGSDGMPGLGSGEKAVSLGWAMGQLDATLIQSVIAHGGQGLRQRLSFIRQESERAMGRYDSEIAPRRREQRAAQRALEERRRRERLAELQRDIARDEQLAALQRQEALERVKTPALAGTARFAAQRRAAQMGMLPDDTPDFSADFDD